MNHVIVFLWGGGGGEMFFSMTLFRLEAVQEFFSLSGEMKHLIFCGGRGWGNVLEYDFFFSS